LITVGVVSLHLLSSPLWRWVLPSHLALHIPDGFLSLPVSLATWVVAVALIAVALKRVESEYKDRTVPFDGRLCSLYFCSTDD
jgi:cobalt/nickel transport system permease protein